LLSGRRSSFLILLFLAAATLLVYALVWNHEFVNFDDDLYVTRNPLVHKGITWEGVKEVFSGSMNGLYHPLTMISHMLDVNLFGIRPGPHHLVNLFLHTLNGILLFLALRSMTGDLFRSGFAAALFLLHPLHVESVAWISERKDALCALFWMLTMLGYVKYVRKPALGTYLLVLILFVSGLMSKPMAVTLPFVLLLLDWWPLSRRKPLRYLFLEKVPLFAFSVVFSFLAVWAQNTVELLPSLEKLPLLYRIENGATSYAAYLLKTLWPMDLSVHYPLPPEFPLWKTLSAGSVLVLITAAVAGLGRRKPYLFVGWSWYLGTLIPVIGLFQVGSHAMADRYTYLPLVGLFLMAAWGIPDLLLRYAWGRRFLIISGAASLLYFGVVAYVQVGRWAGSTSLFEHAVRAAPGSGLAHYNLGVALQQEGRLEEAMKHYGAALGSSADYYEAHNNLGVLLAGEGRLSQAIEHFHAALRIKPDHADAQNNLGLALMQAGDLHEATARFSRAIQLRHEFAEAHFNLGIALFRQGRLDRASAHLREALRIRPGRADVHNALGVVLARQGEFEEAETHFREALRLATGNLEAAKNLRLLLQGSVPKRGE
jgi:protein O-mannosyl-transferase